MTSVWKKMIIVKIGGSAITVKKQLETLKEQQLEITAKQIREASKDGSTGIVVVHGAGCFGHMQARQYGVKDGWAGGSGAGSYGFAAVRRSVCELNSRVVNAFVRHELPAVGMPPFPLWECNDGAVCEDGIAHVRAAVERRLVPVLHGDAVLDRSRGCTILSGDDIIWRLSLEFKPKSVVFLTDVPGVLTAPPEEDGAELIKELLVSADGCQCIGVEGGNLLRTSVDHRVDVTGGIMNKVQAAAKIASSGCPVFIVQNGSEDAAVALAGHRPVTATLIRLAEQAC